MLSSSPKTVPATSENATFNPSDLARLSDYLSSLTPSYDFPRRINDYNVCEPLGSGGFAHVYKAICKLQPHQGKSLAIKMIDKKKINTPALQSRVAKEIEIHSQLHHPSILTLYTFFEDCNNVFLVMELCPQGELYRYIQSRGSALSEAEARVVMYQVVEGLMYMHSFGILHRDLKLSNILLTDQYDIKIADLGLAARMSESEGEQKTLCGTPNYISPEIVSRQPYGLSTDIWSLGCMFYTVLIGKPPFESSLVRNTLDKVSKANYNIPDFLSFEAKDLIHKLLQLEPGRRLSLLNVARHPFFDDQQPRRRLQPISSFVSRPSQVSQLPARTTNLQTQYSNNISDTSHFSRSKSHFNTVEAQNSNPSASKPSSDLPVINTKRLKPLQQTTKYGMVEILQNGRVKLNFIGEHYIMVIIPEYFQVELYRKENVDSSKSTLENNSKVSPVASFSFQELPDRYLKLYRYAVRFVELVRCKTPKIVFYSPQAKCILMENGPPADFEMIFYNNIRIHNSVQRHQLQIKLPPSENEAATIHTVDTSPGKKIQVPQKLLSIFQHVQECLRQCIEIDKSGKLDPNTSYPIILKSSSCVPSTPSSSTPSMSKFSQQHSFHPSALSSYTCPLPSSLANGTASNVTPSCFSPPLAQSSHSAPVSSISSPSQLQHSVTQPSLNSVRSDGDPNFLSHSHPKVFSSSPSHSGVNTNRALTNGITRHVRSGSAGSVISNTSHSSAPQPFQPISSHSVYIPDVGWCVKTPDGRFTMLFSDGIVLAVESKHQLLKWCDKSTSSNQYQSFPIDKHLPLHVRQKLVYFPKFMKMY